MGILIRLAISALALWISTLILKGITLGGDSVPRKVFTLILVAVIFGLVNAILRPVIKTLGCALYILTLGLIALVVNGLLLLLTSWIAGNLDLVHRWLSTDAYWALGRPRETTERAVAASLNYGVFRTADGAQVGYARAITDGATFAWLCDVYIDRGERGAGLGL